MFGMQVWSNLICYDTEGLAYPHTQSNAVLLSVLQPVADFAWHQRYTSLHGPETGGILLNAWIQKMNATIDSLLSTQQSDATSHGVPRPSCALHLFR